MATAPSTPADEMPLVRAVNVLKSFFGNGGKGMMGNNANCIGKAMGDTSSGACG